MARNISKNREKRSNSNTLYRFNDGIVTTTSNKQIVDLQVGPDGHTMLTDADTVPVNP